MPPKKKQRPEFELNAAVLEARALKTRFERLGGYSAFVLYFWEYVDSTPIIWNWHMDILCWMLEALGRRLIRKLLINIPPGHAKSKACSVLWPAWMWGCVDTTWSPIYGSHDEDLALRDAVQTRDLIKHAEYRRIFRPDWDLEAWDFNPSQDTKHLYKNTKGGMRYSTSVGGAITGFRGNAVVVDDPLDANRAPSEVELRKHIDWFGNLPTRLNNLEESQWLVIMQRLCEGDLSDELIRKGGWIHLNLPAEFDPDNRCQIKIGDEVIWEDPRTELGEPLFPQVQPKSVLDELKLYMDDRFEPQYNQRIVAFKGGLVKPDDIRWHEHTPEVIRQKCTQIVLSMDLTFMKTEAKQRAVEERRAYNNLDVWGTDGRNFYLIDTARGRWQYGEFVQIFRELVRRWKLWTILVEDAAVSGVVKTELEHLVGEIVEIPAIGSKETRLQVAARYCRQGRVYYPQTDWAREHLAEVARFGMTPYKDRADTMSQAIIYFTAETGTDLGLGTQSAYSQNIVIKHHNPAGYLR